jgi:hypothetical protein
MATIPNPTNRIITNGLGGPASAGLITMHFHLFHIEVIPPSGGGGGGPYPYVGAWNQATPGRNPAYFNVPRQNIQQPPYLVPVNQPLYNKTTIKLTLKLNNKEVVKYYVVKKSIVDTLVKVHKIYQGIKVQISNIKAFFKKVF